MSTGRPTRTSHASEREASKVSEVVVVVPSVPSIVYVVLIPMGLVVCVFIIGPFCDIVSYRIKPAACFQTVKEEGYNRIGSERLVFATTVEILVDGDRRGTRN